MQKIIKIIVIQIIIDIIYLKLSASHFNKVVNNIQGSDIKLNYYSAAIVYILMAYALKKFILDTSNSKNKIKDAFILGIIIYGVFDFTNMAILKNWNLYTSIMDMFWGGILFAITIYIERKIKFI